MYKKHGSYTCRATLRNFAGNIPTLLNFVGKIPRKDSVGTIPTSVGIIPTFVRIIPSYICRNYSCTAKRCLTLWAMCRNISYKLQQCGNISNKYLQKFSIKLYTCSSFQHFISKLWQFVNLTVALWHLGSIGDFPSLA